MSTTPTTTTTPTTLEDIMALEGGELEPQGYIDAMQRLIDSGIVWSLQGSYGRAAHELILNGYCRQKAVLQ